MSSSQTVQSALYLFAVQNNPAFTCGALQFMHYPSSINSLPRPVRFAGYSVSFKSTPGIYGLGIILIPHPSFLNSLFNVCFLLNLYNLRDVLVHCKGGCALQIGRQMGYHPGCEGCSVQNEQRARCM